MPLPPTPSPSQHLPSGSLVSLSPGASSCPSSTPRPRPYLASRSQAGQTQVSAQATTSHRCQGVASAAPRPPNRHRPPSSSQMGNAGDSHPGRAFLKLVLEGDVRADYLPRLPPGARRQALPPLPSHSHLPLLPALCSRRPGPGPGGILRPGAGAGSGMLSHWPLPGKAGQGAGRSQPKSW